jgi:hypothetical protein
VTPGDIYRHDAFYLSAATGALEPKYLLALAIAPGGDIVARLFTSRAHGRPEDPRCYQGHPYGGYYLGIVGGPLTAKTWVDLRYLPDLDAVDARRLIQRGTLRRIASLDMRILIDVMQCVAAADDTTRAQEKAIRSLLATMR